MTDHSDNAQTAGRKVKVWDIWVRLFHWLLVAFILLSYLTGEVGGFDFTMPGSGNFVSNMTLHMWSGLTIFALLVFRIVWGFAGSTTARFANFLRGPSSILDYVKTVFTGPVKFFAGHNPAGGAVVAIMLLALLVQAVTGMFSQDDSFFATKGPLAHLISDETSKVITGRHELWWEYVIITLIVVHIAANLFYWLVKKQDLIVAMITGRRRLPEGEAEPQLSFAATWLGAVIAVAAGIASWLILNSGG
jgi:cytochrome b